MRAADTYRAVRREAAKVFAKENRLHLSVVWHADKPAWPQPYQPKASKHMPHQGKREKARRAKRFEPDVKADPAQAAVRLDHARAM